MAYKRGHGQASLAAVTGNKPSTTCSMAFQFQNGIKATDNDNHDDDGMTDERVAA